MGNATIDPCPICGSAGRRSREDVLPRWLLGGYEGDVRDGHGRSTEGPWTISLGDRVVATNDHMERVLLDVCEGCNRWSNQEFEVPAKPHVRCLLGGGAISGRDVSSVARWAIKTILLYSHPDTRFTQTSHLEAEGELKRSRFDGLTPVLRGLRSTNTIPHDISLWLWVRSEEVTEVRLADVEPVRLPRIIGPGGGPAQRAGLGLGFTDGSGRSIQFLLCWHPLMDVANPHEGADVLRVWPTESGLIDPGSMKALGRQDSKTAGSWFLPIPTEAVLGEGAWWSM